MQISASGTVIEGMSVAQMLRRNRKITITTRLMDSISVNCTSCTEARMVCVRSMMMLTWIDGGMAASSARQRRLDPVHRVDDVGAGLLEDDQDDAALAVLPARDEAFSGPSTAWPMSFTRTGAPLR